MQVQLAHSFHDARAWVSTTLPGPVGGAVNDALYLVRRLVLPTGADVGLFGTADCVAAKDCSGKDLTGAQHHDQNLNGVDFTGANLTHANFRNADFTTSAGPRPATASDPATATAEAYLISLGFMSRAALIGADLFGANLSGFKLYNVNLNHANLSQANLSNTNLTGATFVDATMVQTNLSNSNLTGADFFNDVYGYGGVLNFANLTNANLTNADLRSTYLGGTNLTGANLTGAKLTGSNLYDGAILTGTTCPNGQVHGSGGNC